MALVGLVRVSTSKQKTRRQHGALKAAAGLRVHPDVMFALGSSARPARRRPISD
jgi:DNA invertase Pin-like site-specific DNA recombinase